MSGLSHTGNRGLEHIGSPWRFGSAAIIRWVLPFVSVGSVVILARVLEHYWHSAPHASLFLCAIMFSAWIGGIKPGSLALALSLLSFKYYFLAPVQSLAMEPIELPRLVLFTLAAVFVLAITGAQKRSEDKLRGTASMAGSRRKRSCARVRPI